MFDVITFGSAVVDVFVDTDLAEKKGFMAYPVGAKILLKNLRFDIGGGGTNTAVAFARLGLKTGFIGKIGDDLDGKEVMNMLKREKVKFLGKIGKGETTGYSVILDSKEHNRTILTYKGTNDNLKFEELKLKKLKTKWLFLTSLLGHSFKTQKKLIWNLAKRGTKIAFNPSLYLIKLLDLRPILRVCEVLIFNKEEAKLLRKKSRIREKDLIKAIYSLGPKVVVITDKNNKIMAYDGEKKYFLKPHDIKAVERTGAGDAFASGFVAGQVLGKGVETSLKLGLRESEAVIRYFGAKNNLIKMRLR